MAQRSAVAAPPDPRDGCAGLRRPCGGGGLRMAAATQSPLLSLPAKATREVDVIKPISQLIVRSYEQNPNTYRAELERIQCARQEATSDEHGDEALRMALFRYFHMLEMLALRFPGLQVPFAWRDAVTRKEATQSALAFEKACILFNAAACLSRLAAAQPRGDGGGEALKRAYTYLRQAAGLLDYLKDSFVHAPSDDLHASTLQTLRTLLLAQASELFVEKTVHDAKSPALIAKLASHTAAAYAALGREWEDAACAFKAPVPWRQLASWKAKHYAATTQLYRARADAAGGAHGAALARFRSADALARASADFAALDTWSMPSSMRATLPSDASAALHQATDTQKTLTAQALQEAERDNDVVYHEKAPLFDTLPPVDQTDVASAIGVRDTFAQPELQRALGPDILPGLVPLSVLESASLYSEEQAKLVRAESARVEQADAEISTLLSALPWPGVLDRYAALDGGAPPVRGPSDAVLAWAAALDGADVLSALDRGWAQLAARAASVRSSLDHATALLDDDAAACERSRRAGAPQTPTAVAARALYRDLQAARDALDGAEEHDRATRAPYADTRAYLQVLVDGVAAVRAWYQDRAHAPPTHLLDSDVADAAPARALLQDIRAQVAALQAMPAEREALLHELKQRVRDDDIARTLLLHRGAQHAEKAIFQQELAKHLPMRQRLEQQMALQRSRIQALHDALDRLAMHPGAADVRRTYDAAHHAADECDATMGKAHRALEAAQSVMPAAQAFYDHMTRSSDQLLDAAERWAAARRAERGAAAPHVAPSAPRATSLADDLAELQLGYGAPSAPPRGPPPPPPRPL